MEVRVKYHIFADVRQITGKYINSFPPQIINDRNGIVRFIKVGMDDD